MKMCKKKSTAKPNFDYTIFLWPGWLDKCARPIGFTSELNRVSFNKCKKKKNKI